MTIIRKKIITIETRHRTVIRQSGQKTFWCEFCETKVKATLPETAALIFGLALDEIYQGIENGQLHFAEIENQTPLICVNSIRGFKH